MKQPTILPFLFLIITVLSLLMISASLQPEAPYYIEPTTGTIYPQDVELVDGSIMTISRAELIGSAYAMTTGSGSEKLVESKSMFYAEGHVSTFSKGGIQRYDFVIFQSSLGERSMVICHDEVTLLEPMDGDPTFFPENPPEDKVTKMVMMAATVADEMKGMKWRNKEKGW